MRMCIKFVSGFVFAITINAAHAQLTEIRDHRVLEAQLLWDDLESKRAAADDHAATAIPYILKNLNLSEKDRIDLENELTEATKRNSDRKRRADSFDTSLVEALKVAKEKTSNTAHQIELQRKINDVEKRLAARRQ